MPLGQTQETTERPNSQLVAERTLRHSKLQKKKKKDEKNTLLVIRCENKLVTFFQILPPTTVLIINIPPG